MLGKRPRPVLQTSSKFRVPDGEDSDQKVLNAQAFSSKPPFLPQHVTVFGFDIPQETKPSDVCESPRSVLDLPSEKHPQGRSFRSCVRAIPLQNRGSHGVGLAIIVELHAEEKGDHESLSYAVSHAGGKEVSASAHIHLPSSTSVCLQSHHHHQQSQPIAIAVNCRSQDHPSTYKVSKYEVEEDDDDDDDDDDDSRSIGSVLDMEIVSSDCRPPWQDFLIHNKGSRNADNDKDLIIRPSIFTVASIPSSDGRFGIRPVSFLDACALCQKAFAPGKDIFMYRGDQAFCSTECRGERIKRDEHKEKLVAMHV